MKRFVVAFVLAFVVSGCASVDKFNRLSANLTHDAIVASEQNRCTVHPKPCLSEDAFKGVNVELNRVSVAGREFTKLRVAGKASVSDVSVFLSTVATTIANLSQAYRDTSIGKVLEKLSELQVKAVKLLGQQQPAPAN